MEQNRSSSNIFGSPNGSNNSNNGGGNAQGGLFGAQTGLDLNGTFQLANTEADEGLNEAAGQLQLLDIFAKEKVARKPGGRPVVEDEGYSVTYTLTGRTSLPSRSDRQLIQIASTPFKAEYSKWRHPCSPGLFTRKRR